MGVQEKEKKVVELTGGGGKLREGGRRAQLFVGEIKTLLDLFGRLHFNFGP